MKSGTCCVIFLQGYLLMTTALDALENAALEKKAENTYGIYSYLVFIICHSGIKLTCKTTNKPFKVMLHETIRNDYFSATQRGNIVATLFRMVTTLFHHYNAVSR